MSDMKKSSIILSVIFAAGLLMPANLLGADTNVATNTVSLTIDGSALLGITTGSSIAMSLGGAAVAGGAFRTLLRILLRD